MEESRNIQKQVEKSDHVQVSKSDEENVRKRKGKYKGKWKYKRNITMNKE